MKGYGPLVVAAVYAAVTTLACSSDEQPSRESISVGGAPSVDGGNGGHEPDAAPPPPAGCMIDGDCTPEQECTGGTCVPKAVCPAGLEPTFASLHTKIFAVSCGTAGNTCHSHDGSTDSGQFNLADDPYTALLGTDGMGAPASNIAGSVRKLHRVVPGDPDHSFLVIKLGTHTTQDPQYGAGMPLTDPGSVCPDTLQTIRGWISAGAKQ